jgi:predicted nucleic acid-binding protein
MRATVYDTGILIAADRSNRSTWAEHRVRLSAGIIPLAPATVVAQVSRSPQQAQLRRFLRGCEVVSFEESSAHGSGALLGKARTSDVVDASVVELAFTRDAEILTTDPEDIARLVTASGKRVPVVPR